MSRLTGNDAYGMMEAYNAVYQPRTELTEEQVWEEVETWVNSLIEEGYDLSEYTWEDMYESYIEEQGRGASAGSNPNISQNPIAKAIRGEGPRPTQTAGQINQARMRPGRSSSAVTASAKTAPTTSPKPQFGTTTPRGSSVTSTGVSGLSAADRAAYSAGGGNAAAQKGMGQTTTQVIAQGKKNLGRMDQGRPAPASAKPTSGGSSVNPKSGLSAYSAAKPAATTPAATKVAPRPAATATGGAKPATAAGGSSAPSTSPARPSLSSQADDIRKMRAASLARQGKTLDAATVSASTKPAYQANSFDLFDVVLGHLLDEGYADTEEAALKIMANMSEEWKSVIIGEERAEGVRPYKAGPTQAEVRADAKKAAKKKAESGKDKPGYGPEDKFKSDWKLRAVPSSTSKTKDGKTETVSQRMNREKPYATRPFSPLFTKQGSRTASAVTRATEGPGEPQSVTMPRKKSKPSREIIRRGDQKESYDYILSHLIYEGYANTVESAEAIISNMSEDWILSIIQ